MRDNCIISASKKSTNTYRPGPRFTKEQRKEVQEKFLKSFASNGNVRAACMAAGVDRSMVHYWFEHDEEFSMQYNLAKEDVNDAIRAEIFRRAVLGEERFVTSAGKVVYHKDKPLTIREKSDTLLIFHAKARMPEYRDRSHLIDRIAELEAQLARQEIKDNSEIIAIDTRDLSAERLAKLKAFALEMKEIEQEENKQVG